MMGHKEYHFLILLRLEHRQQMINHNINNSLRYSSSICRLILKLSRHEWNTACRLPERIQMIRTEKSITKSVNQFVRGIFLLHNITIAIKAE